MAKPCIGFCITRQFCLSSNKSRNKELRTGKEILSYLSQFGDSLNLMYSIDADIAALLSHLSLSITQIQELMDTTKLTLGNTKITYIPQKFFSISYGLEYNSPFAMFANADQYMVAHIDNSSEDIVFKHACEARDVGIEVVKGLNLLNIDPTNLISPINQFLRKYGKKFMGATVDDINGIDPKIGQYFYESCDAGWFECPKVGHFPHVYDYDLKSAYMSALAKLPDIRKGDWQFVEGKKTDAPIGSYLCNINIKSNFSPIGYKAKDFNFTPTGWRTRKVLRQYLDLIDKYPQLGTYEVIDGYEWHPREWDTIYKPLMERLFQLKEENTGIVKDVIKRTGNGIWGSKLSVIRDKQGEWFDPVIASSVEIAIRCKMFEDCIKENVIPISIMLDGLTTVEQLQCLNMGDGMGQWKLSHQGKCAAISADLCVIENKSNNAVFGVDYPWIVEEVEKNPEASRYTMTRNSCVTVGKVLQNPHLLGQLGEIVPAQRSIDLNIEFKRVFPDHPRNGRELLSGKIYESQAPDISMIDPTSLPDIDDTLLTSVG